LLYDVIVGRHEKKTIEPGYNPGLLFIDGKTLKIIGRGRTSGTV
jgi:hypothetical protein